MTKHSRKPLLNDERLMNPDASDRMTFGAAFDRIVGVMARLRSDRGCAWDRSQDLASLKPFVIEEAYEVLDAIDHGSVDDHREELGDLLFQVIFQSEIRRQAGEFDAADVAHTIADKMVRRHPHVFDRADDAEGVATAPSASWEAIKRKEKKHRSAIGGVPRALPSLLRAQRVTEKASKVGFDWASAEGPLDKLQEELAELREAVAQRDAKAMNHEMGDLLFSLVNLARFVDVDAESALSATVDRFEQRFGVIEARLAKMGRSVEDADLDELETLWQAAKNEVG